MFDDGLPVIAFHGTNQPDLIGSAASNGCIRMPNEVVTQLAETIPAGYPGDGQGVARAKFASSASLVTSGACSPIQ